MTIDLRPQTLPDRVVVTVTPSAQVALAHRDVALVAELEILFSCLVRKRVTFRDERPEDQTWVAAPGLHLSVRPVVYDGCRPEVPGGEPPTVGFDAADPEALLPRKVVIDHSEDGWRGEFDFG